MTSDYEKYIKYKTKYQMELLNGGMNRNYNTHNRYNNFQDGIDFNNPNDIQVNGNNHNDIQVNGNMPEILPVNLAQIETINVQNNITTPPSRIRSNTPPPLNRLTTHTAESPIFRLPRHNAVPYPQDIPQFPEDHPLRRHHAVASRSASSTRHLRRHNADHPDIELPSIARRLNYNSNEENINTKKSQRYIETLSQFANILRSNISSGSSSSTDPIGVTSINIPSTIDLHDLYNAIDENARKFTCAICMVNMIEYTLHPCNHAFCKKCVNKMIDRQNDCPKCKRVIEGSKQLYL